jgi:hypothetical protein
VKDTRSELGGEALNIMQKWAQDLISQLFCYKNFLLLCSDWGYSNASVFLERIKRWDKCTQSCQSVEHKSPSQVTVSHILPFLVTTVTEGAESCEKPEESTGDVNAYNNRCPRKNTFSCCWPILTHLKSKNKRTLIRKQL